MPRERDAGPNVLRNRNHACQRTPPMTDPSDQTSDDPAAPVPTGASGGSSDGDLVARVVEVLEMIRPAIQEDGGDIELVAVDEEAVVHIRFLGARIGCPSSEVTLREGIARNLRDRIPEVTGVVPVN